MLLQEECCMSVDHHVMLKERVARAELGLVRVATAWLETLILGTGVLASLVCLGDCVIIGLLSFLRDIMTMEPS